MQGYFWDANSITHYSGLLHLAGTLKKETTVRWQRLGTRNQLPWNFTFHPSGISFSFGSPLTEQIEFGIWVELKWSIERRLRDWRGKQAVRDTNGEGVRGNEGIFHILEHMTILGLRNFFFPDVFLFGLSETPTSLCVCFCSFSSKRKSSLFVAEIYKLLLTFF